MLQDVRDALDVASVRIDGTLPSSVGETLLEDAFVHTRRVFIGDDPCNRTLDALCRALMRTDCLIEQLEVFEVGCRKDCELFADAMAVSTSVRTVFYNHARHIFTRPDQQIPTSTFLACCKASPTIEHLSVEGVLGCLATIKWGEILASLPLLQRVSTLNFSTDPPAEIQRAWPRMVARVSNYKRVFYLEVAKNPEARVSRTTRYYLFVLRACLDGVLPEGVVEDIAALVVKCLDGNDSRWRPLTIAQGD
jgi:hypothetical protein